MKELHKTSFIESLMIQKRVIGALLMREIITRYGRNNIGFLWLFVEPLLMTLTIVLMWQFARADEYSALNIVAFVLTGYPMAMMWRNVSNRAIGAISANVSLLYHRNVRVLDTILARMLLEVVGATIAQIAIIFTFLMIGLLDAPYDIFYMLIAWFLMVVFAIGLGLVICSVAFIYESFGKLWSTFSFMVLPLSGAFFFVHNLPQQIQNYALMIPMVHGTEMFRHGYFGKYMVTYENVFFIIVFDLIILFLGLAMINKFSKGVEPE